MPAGFDRCEASGGKIITQKGPSKKFKLNPGEYRHICIDKSGWHWGYKHTKKEE